MKPKPVVKSISSTEPLTSFNVRQTARSLTLHPETIRDCLRSGRIRGFRVGNRWRVSQPVLSALLTEGVPLAANGQD